MYKTIHLEKYLTVSNRRDTAVVGCGHFVATLRAEVFKSAPLEVCQHKIVGGSENLYFDIPNDEAGFLRLATKNNYAYHLGNAFEPWMKEKMAEVISSSRNNEILEKLPEAKSMSKLQYHIGKLFRILLFKKFKSQYFKLKGINVPY